MATYTLQAGCPEIELYPGMKLILEAVSPTTGAAITGVTATAWAIYGDSIEGFDIDATPVGPYMLVPGPPE